MSETGSDHYLKEKLERDRDLLLAEAFVAPDDRAAYRALFGVRAELRELLHAGSELQVALARLGWWREEWQRLAEGRPRHPLTQALGGHGEFAADDLDGALSGAAQLLQVESTDRFEELQEPAGRMAISLARVDRALFPAAPEHSEDLWAAVAYCDLVLGLPGLLRCGRSLLPMELSARLQVSREDVLRDDKAEGAVIGALAEEVLGGSRARASGSSYAVIYHEIQRRRLREYARRGREPGHFARLWAAWRGARRRKRA